MDNTIALIGLDITGQSIGLALRQAAVEAPRLGYDRDAAAARQAQQAGAVDRVEGSLKAAAASSPLAIVSLPASRLASTLKELAAVLPSDAVVLDASRLKQPAMQVLPALSAAGVHYVGLTPAVSGDCLQAGEFGRGVASADRFRSGVLGVILLPAHRRQRSILRCRWPPCLGPHPTSSKPGRPMPAASCRMSYPPCSPRR